MQLTLKYEPITRKPYWKFYYTGTHSHPVSRTVVVTEVNENYFRGYEIREGASVRMIMDAPLKSYRFDRIAMSNQLRLSNKLSQLFPVKTTLRKISRRDLAKEGI